MSTKPGALQTVTDRPAVTIEDVSHPVACIPLGAALAATEMQRPALARAVPIAVGLVVLIAGAHQLTARKAAVTSPVAGGGTGARPHAAGRRRHRLATWPDVSASTAASVVLV